MSSMSQRKPKNQRSKRAMKQAEAKLIENKKSTLVLNGSKVNGVMNELLTDVFMLKKPDAKHFRRSNQLHPFEDITGLEFLCQKNDCSLFAFGSHTKKRPNNLVLGRMFDYHLLDMVEFETQEFQGLKSFKGIEGGFAIDNKPCMVFQGPEFDNKPEFQSLKNLLLDFFKGMQVSSIHSRGLDHVYVCTAHEEPAVAGGEPTCTVLFRHYKVKLFKSSDSELPRVELVEMGPSANLKVRRTRWASTDLMKDATKQPKALKPKKTKNIEHTELGGKRGRVHVERQDLNQMALSKFKKVKQGPLDEVAPARTEVEEIPEQWT